MKKKKKQSDFKKVGILATKLIVVLLAFYGLFSIVDSATSANSRERISVQIQEATQDKATPSEILKLINKERKKVGRASLKMDHRLNDSATKKAKELSNEGWDNTPHVNNRGIQGYTYALEFAGCTTAGENLSEGHTTSKEVVQAWMDSPPHREAMLGDFTTAGIGIKNTYIALHLCRY